MKAYFIMHSFLYFFPNWPKAKILPAHGKALLLMVVNTGALALYILVTPALVIVMMPGPGYCYQNFSAVYNKKENKFKGRGQ